MQQKQKKMNIIQLKEHEYLAYISCQALRSGVDNVAFRGSRENIEKEAAKWLESRIAYGSYLDISALIIYDGPYDYGDGNTGTCTRGRSQQLYYYSHCHHCHAKEYVKNFNT